MTDIRALCILPYPLFKTAPRTYGNGENGNTFPMRNNASMKHEALSFDYRTAMHVYTFIYMYACIPICLYAYLCVYIYVFREILFRVLLNLIEYDHADKFSSIFLHPQFQLPYSYACIYICMYMCIPICLYA